MHFRLKLLIRQAIAGDYILLVQVSQGLIAVAVNAFKVFIILHYHLHVQALH